MRAALLLAVAVAITLPAAAATAAPASAAGTSRVVVVVMENKEHGQVLGSRQAPYVNRLARRYSAPSRYYGVRHPSLPNYIALLSGSTLGITQNCTGCNRAQTNLVDQFEQAGISWRAYMEGMPSACYDGSDHGRYVKKHNPFAYFDTITGDPARCANVVPASRLATDRDSGALPEFVWLTPGLCNDSHDCSVAHGDRYLSRTIPPLLRTLGPHGFLVLTWDEGESNAGCCGGLAHGGRIPTVIAGPDVRRGSRPRTPLTHYSTLRTIEDAFGLPRLRNAGSRSVRGLGSAFRTPPRLR